MERENLTSGVLGGIFLGFIIGALISWTLETTFASTVLILSLAMLPGFFIISLLYILKLRKERISTITRAKKIDWGVEINLKKLQIIHNKHSSLIQALCVLAGASFLVMGFLIKDFPVWMTGHMIFFPVATLVFIFSLHLAFRWWFAMRSDYQYLQFYKTE